MAREKASFEPFTPGRNGVPSQPLILAAMVAQVTDVGALIWRLIEVHEVAHGQVLAVLVQFISNFMRSIRRCNFFMAQILFVLAMSMGPSYNHRVATHDS